MRTALMTFSFLYGEDLSGRPRVERVKKFLKYYSKLQSQGLLNIDQLWLSDNGGPEEQLADIKKEFPHVGLIEHPLMVRGHGIDCLPCWRMLYDYRRLIEQGFNKIIIMDDDAYILTARLMKHVNELNTGWETFWCPRYNFPEGALSVLCQDAFPIYLDYTAVAWDSRNKQDYMERMMPYTKINKDFNTDRWGEDRAKQTPEMDGYFQCPADIEMKPCL